MRVPSDGLQSTLTTIIQADYLGVGMAKVIRNLMLRLRDQRREAAREQAMKAPVKMLLPMVFFIFPSLFIVILGPLMVKVLTEGLL
jgi:tight adherence protein C